MNCPHCGAKMSKHARNCPECGAPRDLPVDDRTTVLQREPIEEQTPEPEAKTIRMPQMPSAEPAHGPVAAPEAEPTPIPASEPEPEPRKRSLLPIVIVVVALCIVATLFALNTCDKPASEPRQSEPVEEPSAHQTDEGEAAANPTDTHADGADEADTSGDQGEQDGAVATDEGTAEVDQATLDGWSETARAALTIYPSNHVLAGGADDEPSELSLESWTDSLMQYVDSSSSLGQALLDDPEAVATPLGFFEAASYVSSTEVTSTGAEGVNVTVTLEATQMDWSMTSTVTEQYLVKFNSDGLITDIVSVG